MITFVSQIVVLVIGVTIFVGAGRGIFAPEKLMRTVTSVINKSWGIYFAVIVRLVLGLALIIVAPASLFPIVFQVLGVFAIIAAMALVFMGRERVRKFIAWWSERISVSTIRVWLVIGMAFGGFLVYGVL